MESKTLFFGWTNFKWLITELGKMGSNQESYFSLKRCQNILAFSLFLYGWLLVLIQMVSKPLVMSECVLWAITLLSVCGYYTHKIQEEKITENKLKSDAELEVK